MQRFFRSSPLSIDMTIAESDFVHQISRVLRYGPGDRIILFDGDGSETEYEITQIDKKSVVLRGISRSFPKTEPKRRVILIQALPNKIEKIEYILQKWVEVGIHKFIFFRSDRSQKLVISESKIARMREIVREAVEQCGGLSIPEIYFHIDTKGSIERISSSYGGWDGDTPHITLDTFGDTLTLREIDNTQDVVLWVGPEWGWSEEERSIMNDNGFIFAHFGQRILRTETAGVVVSFALINQ